MVPISATPNPRFNFQGRYALLDNGAFLSLLRSLKEKKNCVLTAFILLKFRAGTE